MQSTWHYVFSLLFDSRSQLLSPELGMPIVSGFQGGRGRLYLQGTQTIHRLGPSKTVAAALTPPTSCLPASNMSSVPREHQPLCTVLQAGRQGGHTLHEDMAPEGRARGGQLVRGDRVEPHTSPRKRPVMQPGEGVPRMAVPQREGQTPLCKAEGPPLQDRAVVQAQALLEEGGRAEEETLVAHRDHDGVPAAQEPTGMSRGQSGLGSLVPRGKFSPRHEE